MPPPLMISALGTQNQQMIFDASCPWSSLLLLSMFGILDLPRIFDALYIGSTHDLWHFKSWIYQGSFHNYQRLGCWIHLWFTTLWIPDPAMLFQRFVSWIQPGLLGALYPGSSDGFLALWNLDPTYGFSTLWILDPIRFFALLILDPAMFFLCFGPWILSYFLRFGSWIQPGFFGALDPGFSQGSLVFFIPGSGHVFLRFVYWIQPWFFGALDLGSSHGSVVFLFLDPAMIFGALDPGSSHVFWRFGSWIQPGFFGALHPGSSHGFSVLWILDPAIFFWRFGSLIQPCFFDVLDTGSSLVFSVLGIPDRRMILDASCPGSTRNDRCMGCWINHELQRFLSGIHPLFIPLSMIFYASDPGSTYYFPTLWILDSSMIYGA